MTSLVEDSLRFLGIHRQSMSNVELHDTTLGMYVINPSTYHMVIIPESIASAIRIIANEQRIFNNPGDQHND